jgi:hypothetical protein
MRAISLRRLMSNDQQPNERFASIEELKIRFKKRFRQAKTPEEEAAIRVEWQVARDAFWATRQLNGIEDLDAYYRDMLANASRDVDQSAIRLAWASAKADYYERRWKLSSSGQEASEQLAPAPPPLRDPEMEAIADARRMYGDPIGATGNAGRAAGSIPAPIEIRLPIVAVTESKENSP